MPGARETRWDRVGRAETNRHESGQRKEEEIREVTSDERAVSAPIDLQASVIEHVLEGSHREELHVT